MKKNSGSFKIAILSISILLTSANAMAGAIPLMGKHFSNVSQTQIESLATIPSFTVLLFVLISTKLVEKISARKIVMTGILLVLISGVVPYFASTFWMIFVSRLFLGAGIGLFNAFAYSLISEYYSGDERQRLLGYEGSVTSLGNIIMFVVTAGLIAIDWRSVYLYYVIALPILIIFWFGTRKLPDKVVETESIENIPVKQEFNLRLATMTLLVMFSMFVSTTVVIKISGLVVNAGYGNEMQATIGLAILGIATMIGGALYGRLYKVLSKFILPIGLLGAALAIFGMTISTNLAFTYSMAGIAGLTTSQIGPYLFAQATESVGPGQATLASAILIVGINVGVVLTPYLLGGVQKLINSSGPKPILVVVDVLMVVVGLATLFMRQPKSK